ncbi:rhodanese-like domain-containing protein [Winogradskyella immobilis]|uniref:Rhodanese-like domain-containing protein n=1 Tax=Winogradskyella immobilis TaxID=2816852 RepID=A0ABS8ELG1_9FLAO|nr:rhodanese-like domain-containing protein [Winogradskyella immobilis]MCC1483147.1 rhodanese-like domain-containing protein [Winogradskyella immobilis]MCG0015242.1 rhodanese-like domain-containing protein [Winogradskyella immobilis]
MKQLLLIVFSIIAFKASSQESLSELLKKSNTESVPYISVQELAMPKTKAVLLDAREFAEYKVSHLENAIHVGYDFFDINSTQKKLTDKSATIVVYCSLGIRSEDVAEQLKKSGYTNVFNLYGGIFEWKNKNRKVYSSEGKPTEKVHVFSEEWGKWLTKGEKIYNSNPKN